MEFLLVGYFFFIISCRDTSDLHTSVCNGKCYSNSSVWHDPGSDLSLRRYWFVIILTSVCMVCLTDIMFCVSACGTPNGIKPQDPIRCRNCGYRILYKIRTKRRKFVILVMNVFLCKTSLLLAR